MGEDYSGHPALRPLASLGVALRAFNIAPGNSVEPLSVQILPYQLRFNIFAIRELPASNSFGGEGRITPGILPSAHSLRSGSRFARSKSLPAILSNLYRSDSSPRQPCIT